MHGQISCTRKNDNGFRIDKDFESCGYGLYSDTISRQGSIDSISLSSDFRRVVN
jgi:hypothetical protein